MKRVTKVRKLRDGIVKRENCSINGEDPKKQEMRVVRIRLTSSQLSSPTGASRSSAASDRKERPKPNLCIQETDMME
jgi:hypothetical protein